MDEKQPPPLPSYLISMDKQLSSGTYGSVYPATDIYTNVKYASKIFNEPCLPGTIREIAILSQLEHENIVELRDIVITPYETVSIMKSYPITLYDAMYKMKDPLSFKQCVCYFYQLLQAAAYLESKNIIHRDIKPTNILSDYYCNLVLADFGSSRIIQPPQSPMRGEQDTAYETICTLWYRPPEVVLEYPFTSHAFDMWSIGCVAIEMFSKVPIFSSGKGSKEEEIDLWRRWVSIMGLPTVTCWPDISKCRDARRYLKKVQLGDIDSEEGIIPPMSMPIRWPMNSAYVQLAVDLIARLIVYNPSQRLTARQALDHGLFKEIVIHKSLTTTTTTETIFNVFRQVVANNNNNIAKQKYKVFEKEAIVSLLKLGEEYEQSCAVTYLAIELRERYINTPTSICLRVNKESVWKNMHTDLGACCLLLASSTLGCFLFDSIHLDNIKGTVSEDVIFVQAMLQGRSWIPSWWDSLEKAIGVYESSSSSSSNSKLDFTTRSICKIFLQYWMMDAERFNNNNDNDNDSFRHLRMMELIQRAVAISPTTTSGCVEEKIEETPFSLYTITPENLTIQSRLKWNKHKIIIIMSDSNVNTTTTVT